MLKVLRGTVDDNKERFFLRVCDNLAKQYVSKM